VKEHGIQNEIRNELAGKAFCFRANVGRGWQGTGKPFRATSPIVVALKPGDMVLRQARPFDTGLPAGFHDLFGWVEVTITPDMVGEKFARFFSMDAKAEKGRVSAKQDDFSAAVNGSGGVAGIARSSQDAIELVQRAKLARRCH
jgi:hypothetical protein